MVFAGCLYVWPQHKCVSSIIVHCTCTRTYLYVIQRWVFTCFQLEFVWIKTQTRKAHRSMYNFHHMAQIKSVQATQLRTLYNNAGIDWSLLYCGVTGVYGDSNLFSPIRKNHHVYEITTKKGGFVSLFGNNYCKSIWIYFTWPLRKQAAYKQATRGPTALSPFRGTRQWG